MTGFHVHLLALFPLASVVAVFPAEPDPDQTPLSASSRSLQTATPRRGCRAPLSDERTKERVDDFHAAKRWTKPRGGGMAGRDQRECLGVFHGDVPDRVRELLKECLPVLVELVVHRGGEVCQERGDDAFEEVFFSVYVSVQRHRFNA